ncbi:MAG TPA: hypothetical protein VJO99_25915 [Burkholderiaceae bacterium]|nr:hypothetical protein [Burkholderiaceae bacterium]
MSGGEILRAALTGSPFPTDAQDRVRQDAADEEDPYPFIIFRRVDVKRERGLDNTLLATREMFHVECWGETREQSDLLEAQAIAALDAAGYPCDGNDPDGVDPDIKVRAGVFAVPIWS